MSAPTDLADPDRPIQHEIHVCILEADVVFLPFEDGLAATVDWFRANEAWWRPIKSGEWEDYYRRQYGDIVGGSE